MAGKHERRCLLCGRLLEGDTLADTSMEAAFLEEAPPKAQSFCPICEAKIKKEAKDTQREPKPM